MAIISPLKKIFNWQLAGEKIKQPIYTSYAGIFTQTGTDDPVFKVLANDTDLTVSWTRIGPGRYRGAFDKNVSYEKFFMPGNTSFAGNRSIQYTLGNQGGSLGYMMIYPSTIINFGPIIGIYLDITDDTYAYVDWSTLCTDSELYFEFRVYN